jgi:hypothetical protein
LSPIVPEKKIVQVYPAEAYVLLTDSIYFKVSMGITLVLKLQKIYGASEKYSKGPFSGKESLYNITEICGFAILRPLKISDTPPLPESPHNL